MLPSGTGKAAQPDLLAARGKSHLRLGWSGAGESDCVIFFDALRIKVSDEGLVRNKAVYIAPGVQADGKKNILDLWIENTEGAKSLVLDLFRGSWLHVMNKLKNRGVSDVLIAVVGGLRSFPEAVNAVIPQTIVQT
jgi:putative transposase